VLSSEKVALSNDIVTPDDVVMSFWISMSTNCILVIITWYFFVNPCIFIGEHTKTEKHILLSTMSFVLTNAPCVTTAYALS
jgi:hypothetical protein